MPTRRVGRGSWWADDALPRGIRVHLGTDDWLEPAGAGVVVGPSASATLAKINDPRAVAAFAALHHDIVEQTEIRGRGRRRRSHR